jgi:hypothetical protein
MGGDNVPYEDPGWWRGYKRMRSTDQEHPAAGIIVARMLFVGLLWGGLGIGFVLIFISVTFGTPDLLAGLVVGPGLLGNAAAAWSARRALDISSEQALAASWRTNFFLGFALNEAPLLIAFALTFLIDETWPYFVDLPFWLFGMYLIAPSARNLARRQQQIIRAGSSLSIGAALSASTEIET